MENYENPHHEGNGPKYHTGQPCYERGCQNEAGTAWSPHWCFPHNVARMKGIDASMKAMERDIRARAAIIDSRLNSFVPDGGEKYG